MSDEIEAAAKKALEPQPDPTKTLPRELQWLLDAPLFIDTLHVEAFYDAVLRPDYEGDTLVLSKSVSTDAQFEGGLTVGAGIPWFGKGDVTLGGSLGHTRGAGREGSVRIVSNAYRHLLSLAMHYAGSKPDRLVLSHPHEQEVSTRLASGKPADLADPGLAAALPRALVFLELGPGTKFIPTALEVEGGHVRTVFDELAAALTVEGEPAAWEYPKSDASDEERERYWQWYADFYKNRAALSIVENAASDGRRLSWIDFRVPLGSKEGKGAPFVHLHLAARGAYDTGVFAYNLVGRGFKHGVRVVGTLKSEPDLNVLAIFDR